MDQLVLPRPAVGRAPVRPKQTRIGSPRLSVVIVNYHQWSLTTELVHQITRSPRVLCGEVEVVVINNHSGFHPHTEQLRSTPGVAVVPWRRNRGFATAVNEGGRLGRGAWILLLNPDMSLSSQFLERVMATLDECEEEPAQPGIVGFGLANDDGTQQKSTGPFPTLWRTLARRVLPRCVRKYHLGQVEPGSRVDWVSGCCLLVRRACWEDLDGLDPAFFLYYEDVDLCRRAADNGWEVVYQPGPKAVHHHPLHSRTVPAHIHLVTRHALLTYAEKHWPRWQVWLLRRIVRAETAALRLWSMVWGDSDRSRVLGELEELVGEMSSGEFEEASHRLHRVVWSQERQRAEVLGDRPQS